MNKWLIGTQDNIFFAQFGTKQFDSEALAQEACSLLHEYNIPCICRRADTVITRENRKLLKS